jgi:hypothetical protein
VRLGVARDDLPQRPVELQLVEAQPLPRRLGALDQGWRAQLGQLPGAGRDLGQELAAPVSCADIPPGDRAEPDGQGLGQRLAGTCPDGCRDRLGEGATAGDRRRIGPVGLANGPPSGEARSRAGMSAQLTGANWRTRRALTTEAWMARPAMSRCASRAQPPDAYITARRPGSSRAA